MRSFIVAFFITVRSIGRGNLGVTLLTILMLILASLNLIFVPSLLDGIVFSANDKLINTFSSNIIIEPGNDKKYIENVDELVKRIQAIDGVIGVTYRNSMGAELTFDDEHTNSVVKGVPPELEKQVFNIEPALFEGSYLVPSDMGQILLGAQLAGANRDQVELFSSSLKNVHAGDKITISYANGVKKQYLVKGIFYTEFIQTDLQAFVTEREFRTVSALATDRAMTVNVKIKDDNQAGDIIAQINGLRSGLDFKTWQDTAGIVQSMTTSFRVINNILSIINLLVAGITVFIVTYIDLAHKRRQIGIERAIGITPVVIVMSYVFRAVFYAVVAGVAAAFLYIYGVVPLEARYPFHFPFGNVLLSTSGIQFVRASVTILGVSIIAALLPVWQTIRIGIINAIWG